ncbi:hypothetical protein JHW43_002692 [Diplocarpon mali]|nr:hypothetical protein JHW43_002692 [Diplocarpon mali]
MLQSCILAHRDSDESVEGRGGRARTLSLVRSGAIEMPNFHGPRTRPSFVRHPPLKTSREKASPSSFSLDCPTLLLRRPDSRAKLWHAQSQTTMTSPSLAEHTPALHAVQPFRSLRVSPTPDPKHSAERTWGGPAADGLPRRRSNESEPVARHRKQVQRQPTIDPTLLLLLLLLLVAASSAKSVKRDSSLSLGEHGPRPPPLLSRLKSGGGLGELRAAAFAGSESIPVDHSDASGAEPMPTARDAREAEQFELTFRARPSS